MRRVILFLVDGLRPDVAERHLAAGRLPHMADLTRTAGRTRAITAFPSTTSVAYLPFLTGCLPGRANIPSIRWLDRAAYGGKWWRDRQAVRSYCGYQAGCFDADIAPDVATMFQLVPESIGIFTPIARGLTPERDPARIERQFWGAVAHYLLWHQPSDDAVSKHLLRAVEQPHRFIFAQFPAVDGYSHQTTPEAPKVLAALELVDRTMGRVIERLRVRGELEDTLILVVSDHGATTVHTHLDLALWFLQQGVPTLAHPVMWTRNPRAAVMVAGNGSAMVYARPGEGKTERWLLDRLRTPEAFGHPEDLVAKLSREPAVAFLAGARADGGIAVVSVSPEGGAEEAYLHRRGDAVSYTIVRGDPLRLGGSRTAHEREWLAATWNGAYPDAPAQLLSLFDSPRTGDLLVVCREGYDLRDRFEVPEHKAGHGSFHLAHMQIPLWANRPVPRETVRSVDLFPAMLDWLDVPVPEGISGVPVWRPRTDG